jgi:hypothetical protein
MEKQTQVVSQTDGNPGKNRDEVNVDHHVMYLRLIKERLVAVDRLVNNALEFSLLDKDREHLEGIRQEMVQDLEYLEKSESTKEFRWIKQLEVLEESITWLRENVRIVFGPEEGGGKKKKKQPKAVKMGPETGT